MRTQVTGTGIGSQTVNSGEEVVLTCQVRVGSHSPCLIASIFFQYWHCPSHINLRKAALAIKNIKEYMRRSNFISPFQTSVDPRLSPSLRRVWLKDEQPLDTRAEARLEVREEELVISEAEVEDEGRYECQVRQLSTPMKGVSSRRQSARKRY